MTDAERAEFEARWRPHIAANVIGDNPPPLDAATAEVIRRTLGATPLDPDTVTTIDADDKPASAAAADAAA